MKTYEEKVETLEDEMNELNEKLLATNTEINAKEALVKQHAKVAEEAFSGMLFLCKIKFLDIFNVSFFVS